MSQKSTRDGLGASLWREFVAVTALAVAGPLSFIYAGWPAGVTVVAGLVAMAGFLRQRACPEAPPAPAAPALNVGDWIVVHDGRLDRTIEGRVTSLEPNAALITTRDRNTVWLPTALLERTAVTQIRRGHQESHHGVVLTLDFSVPAERALRILQAGAREALDEAGEARVRPPVVLVKEANDVGVVYEVRYWLRSGQLGQAEVNSRILRCILDHLRVAGLAPAYPKQDQLYYDRASQHRTDLESVEARVQALGRIPLFKDLDADTVRTLAGSVRTKAYRSGDAVIVEGAVGDSMFLLVEGLLGVCKEDADGRSVVQVARLRPGDFFGEMSLLTGQARTATVKAETDVVALEISRENLRELLVKEPVYALRMSAVAAERMLGNQKQLEHSAEAVRPEEVTRMVNRILGAMRVVYHRAEVAN